MNVRALVREAIAVALVGVVIVFGMAMASFSPADPSFNHATRHAATNLAGTVGAYLADFLYQLFGYAAWIVPALVLALAGRLAWGRKPYLGTWTSLLWLPCMLGLAALLHAHVSGAAMKLPAGSGGALGEMFGDALRVPLHAIGRDVVLLALTLSSFVAASQFSLLLLGRRLLVLLGIVLDQVNRLLAGLRATARERKERMEAREQRQKVREARPEPVERIEPEIARPVTVNVSKRAREEQQPELGLKMPAAAAGASSAFKLPSLNLFHKGKSEVRPRNMEALQAMARILEKKLLDYRVEGNVVAVQPGPVVTQFEFEPAPGTKVNRIVALQDDLARAMAAVSVRVAGNIPGKSVIGIEIPNEERESVALHQVLASREFSDKKHILPLALGVDIAGHPIVVDLARMPHLLVAGTTGSGKSVSVNAMICSMLMTHSPENLRMILVDPKMLELSVYDDIPHLLVPVVTNPTKASKALAWAVYEMERRYQLMSDAKVRNIDGYNQAIRKQPGAEHLPYIVIVIDELADLMMVAGKEVEQSICRIAQKARAAGLHLILATQRPSVDVITGLIKANLPSRISFQVSSKIDSRTILDQMGAEQLLGQGDSLVMLGGREIRRVHGAFVSDGEVLSLVEHLKSQGEPDYREEVFEVAESGGPDAAGGEDDNDDKYDEAVDLVIDKGQCSVSMVQRYLRIGYNRASRLVERMEREGLVTPPGSGGIRKVLARSEARGGGVIE
ncbi:MAG TPA: DNA translocase FtsK 4TM domain-containing protein [Mariprofundaceae bacterium]|nr:DNA translocase FtsK 4TM domain-containing protein [Mariprofundaceae bacterium]